MFQIPTCSLYNSESFNAKFHNRRQELSVIHFNIRSLKNKGDRLDHLFTLLTTEFDVLVFSETWLLTHDDRLHFNNYAYNGLLRPNGRGGGLAIYAKCCYPHSVLEDYSIMSPSVECLAVSLPNVIVVAIYRPPTGNKREFLDFLEKMLENLNSSTLPFVLMGDININLLHDDPCTADFNGVISSFACYNHITLPTRITLDTATLLDVCVTNIEPRNIESGLLSSDISDHIPIFCFINRVRERKVTVDRYMTRQINDKNLNKFQCLIRNINWHNIYSIDDVNRAYSEFIKKFLNAYNDAFPLIRRRVNRKKFRKPWITKHLHEKICTKNKMYHSFIQNRDPNILKEYKKYRNQLSKELKTAKTNYFIERFTRIQNDSGKVWREVANLTKGKDNNALNEISTPDGNLCGFDLACAFNKYFVNVGKPLGDTPEPDNVLINNITSLSKSVFFSPSSSQEIVILINKLKNDVSAGHDDIKSVPIKRVAPLISDVLSYLVNLMFTTGVFPDDLKIAKVCPIYKSGNRMEMSNYRPISVLPVFSKLFEGVINCRLECFFTKHNLISACQYGFLKKKSAEQALLVIKDKILENIEHKHYTLGLFLDFRKAFDCVQHNILLEKLNYYGVRGVTHNLVQDYLRHRMQYVRVNDVASNRLTVTCGVPQGSILGPLLFLIYINDITKLPGSHDMIMYADDTNIFFTAKSLVQAEATVNWYLGNLQSWLQRNMFSLNLSKTSYIIFRPINTADSYKANIQFGRVRIHEVDCIKFLGVWFHQNLSWNTHVSKLASEISKSVGCLYKVACLVPVWLRLQMYYALVYSKLTYCILVWGTTTPTNYQKLLVLQKRALRCIHGYRGRPKDFSTLPLFRTYDLLKANQVYLFRLLQYIKSNQLHTQDFTLSNDAYHFRKQIHRVPKTRTNYGKQKLNYQVTVVINKMLTDVDFDVALKLFKKQTKKYLLESDLCFV